jgi:hypothetical protein
MEIPSNTNTYTEDRAAKVRSALGILLGHSILVVEMRSIDPKYADKLQNPLSLKLNRDVKYPSLKPITVRSVTLAPDSNAGTIGIVFNAGDEYYGDTLRLNIKNGAKTIFESIPSIKQDKLVAYYEECLSEGRLPILIDWKGACDATVAMNTNLRQVLTEIASELAGQANMLGQANNIEKESYEREVARMGDLTPLLRAIQDVFSS